MVQQSLRTNKVSFRPLDGSSQVPRRWTWVIGLAREEDSKVCGGLRQGSAVGTVAPPAHNALTFLPITSRSVKVPAARASLCSRIYGQGGERGFVFWAPEAPTAHGRGS